jgi:DHA1 family bicyclomycin/chloramphenicol resistance-like MFS transporter
MNEALRPDRLGTPATPTVVEFVALIALMMGLTALSIDNLLPAFQPIQADFAVASENDLQLLVYVYMIGFAIMQLVYGPVSDIVGRRPTLLIGLAVYAVGCVMALAAPSFTVLLVARAVQGMGVAAARVLAVAIVRDCYEGREMARIMSLTIMVFIVIPVFAPAIGSFTLLFGTWHLIFGSMLLLAVVLTVWFWLRMPETLHPEYRFPFSARRIYEGVRITVTSREAVGYSTAIGLLFGCLMGYVGSAQQIFETAVYNLGSLFPVAFGAIAAVMGFASWVNSRLVRRLGMRRLSHVGILGFLAFSLVQLGVALAFDGHPPLFVFGALLATIQFLTGLTMPNFNTMAMEPLGSVAGTASSFTGFYTTLVGAVLGLLVGQAFDGTVMPLTVGYAVLGAAAALVVLWTENWRLFRPHHPDPRA